MSTTTAAWVVVILAVLVANLPWLSEKFLLIIRLPHGKRAWQRLLEWLLWYGVMGLLAAGMEKRLTGEVHAQDWEFYVVTFCLFAVFAIPGFVYRYELRKYLR